MATRFEQFLASISEEGLNPTYTKQPYTAKRPELLRLLSELDQHLTDAVDGYLQVPINTAYFIHRAEIIDGLQAARDDVVQQLTQSP